MFSIQKIVSGGQTGADRAALDWAMTNNIPHGGWCPKGRIAEDGKIDSTYQLTETPDPNYAQRTAWNVRDCDATVIFSIAQELTGGSAFTEHVAHDLGRPCLHVSRDRDGVEGAVMLLTEFLNELQPKVLNIAGSRASNEPVVGIFVREVLDEGENITI